MHVVVKVDLTFLNVTVSKKCSSHKGIYKNNANMCWVNFILQL